MQVLENSDSYKLSHHGFMDEKTEKIYSNQTPRTCKYMPVLKEFYDEKAVFFGLQYFIKSFLIEEWDRDFFSRPKKEVIAKFKRRTDSYLGKDSVNMERFEELHDLGYLPLKIKALPEGSCVPMKVPFLTIVNTNNRFAWLTNYLETVLSCEVWKPCFTATLTRSFRKMIEKYADETVGNRNHTLFQLHGFEFRGMSGRHDAAISGAGLLLNSCGTDTIPAISLLEDYYGADAEKELIAASVPASEHAVMSLGTSISSELEFFREAITKCYPKGIVSLVSDTFDFFRVVTEYASILKDDILNRQVNEFGLAKVVFRPDSGDPIKIVCGDPSAPAESPEFKGAVECLWEVFGGTLSEKGYKILHERVSVIYGDSCTQPIVFGILEGLKKKGFASNNILFGIGSYSMNFCTRDSLGIAQKATWAQVDGIGHELFKAPKTDDGMKKSAKGLLRVDLVNGEYVLKDQCSPEEEDGGELVTVFEDGKIIKEYSLKEIRRRVGFNV